MIPSLLIALLSLAAETVAAQDIATAGPNSNVQMTIHFEGGRLAYSIARRGSPVITASRLGIIVDGMDLGNAATLDKVDRYRIDETYPARGVHSQAVNRANGSKISFKQQGANTSFTLDVRAFDDGVAFRFIVPGDGRRIPDEATVFTIPDGSAVWYHDFEGHYEGVHKRKDISEVRAGEWAATPLTFKLPGSAGYASIAEAALANYSGMALQAVGEGAFRAVLGHAEPVSYPFRLRYGETEAKRLANPAATEGAITTPWRVVIAAADLNGLVNSDIISNVSPPPDQKLFPNGLHTSWIKPGRSLWKYLDGGENTEQEMRSFTRAASELGFEYNLLEGFWRNWNEAQLRDYVQYSNELGVGIILWKHSNQLRDPVTRRQFFRWCHDLGVAGVKVDFFDHEAKEAVDLYRAILKDAAEFQLVVGFHGANKPTGEWRTFPNELTREGVQGLEHRSMNTWSEHNATLPFTRMLAGPADYTPMIFGERRRETSWAHQIATPVVFTSPLLVFGAHPKSILDSPAVDVIKSIPATWDETIVLPISEIGEIAAFARRRGNTWFVAILNGPNARAVKVDLSFLRDGSYRTTLVRDNPENPADLSIQNTTMTAKDSLSVVMRKGGGFVGRFSK